MQLAYASGPYNTSRRDELPVPPTTIAAAGDRFVVAWPRDGLVTYLVAGDGINRVDASAEDVRLGLACDGADCIIAFGRSKDVHALAFDVGRLRGPDRITVAATDRTERVPQAHALGRGRFLVLYRSDGSDGARINWRIVEPEPVPRKGRAIL
jgi:hypothetical protein